MSEKFKLNDSFLTSISGGYLPENWQHEVDLTIEEFKSYTDEQIATTGYQHNAEELIAFFADQNKREGVTPATPEEFERVASYVRAHY